ncbi:hypothetical protein [Georgenia sp. AZ-5]|uniref:hypothetical protein n=1 Tax=Georgenia sp. AZ-5 TaxID=3367526 RepID=UPI0037542C9E
MDHTWAYSGLLDNIRYQELLAAAEHQRRLAELPRVARGRARTRLWGRLTRRVRTLLALTARRATRTAVQAPDVPRAS